jgi:hypothetical protein
MGGRPLRSQRSAYFGLADLSVLLDPMGGDWPIGAAIHHDRIATTGPLAIPRASASFFRLFQLKPDILEFLFKTSKCPAPIPYGSIRLASRL